MKILVDIGHPAHVHYFRNAIKSLEKKGHSFVITTRDKEVTLDLLQQYGFSYTCTGKNLKGGLLKFFSLIRNDIAILKVASKHKPDLILSFFSPFAAQVGKLLRIPVIGFTDSEFAKLSIRLTKPFTDHIFTPECFTTNLGTRHRRFKGYMESFYLHPTYFTPDKQLVEAAGLRTDKPIFILRFVSFQAGHDAGEKGIDTASKLKIAEFLATKGQLIISSEGPLPPALQQYKIKIAPAHFHHLLAFADLYVGEGITTASECAVLGTPAVLINTIRTGYITEQEQLGLLHQFPNAGEAFETIRQLAQDTHYKAALAFKRDAMLKAQIDCTAFLVDLIHRFPQHAQADATHLFRPDIKRKLPIHE